MDFDIIVVGAGLGGLTTASRLAVLGYKVGVFEQHFIAGGYATNFKRKGYQFDVSLHGIGGLEQGGSLHRILEACHVGDKIKPLRNHNAYSVIMEKELIDIPNDMEEYKKVLKQRFVRESGGIDKLFAAIKRFESGFKRFVLNEKGALGKFHPDTILFMKWSGKTCYEVVKHYVKDEEFIRLFTTLWMYYGLPPKELSALYFFIPWISYHHHGKYYIEGGAQKLSDSFVEVIKQNGGEVFLRSNVVEITNQDNSITGIKLENGQEYKSKWVVSNANPIHTLALLKPNCTNEKLEQKVTQSKVGCTLSQLYIGLDCNPSELHIPEDEVFVYGGASHEEDYKLGLANCYEEAGFLLTHYNSMDPHLNSKDKGVVTMTYMDNYTYWEMEKEDYRKKKAEVVEKMIKRLEQYYPNIREHIVVAELGTPKTMERYTKNPLGAVYGYAQDLSNSGRHRLKKETSIKNLSFVGAWVNPGGGYEGAISGGMVEAIRIQSKLNK